MCHDPFTIGLNKQANIARYLDKVLLTFQSFKPDQETVKGFNRAALNAYLGRAAPDTSSVWLARGGVIGGTREYLEVASLALDAVIKSTLTAGYMGNDETVLRFVVQEAAVGRVLVREHDPSVCLRCVS